MCLQVGGVAVLEIIAWEGVAKKFGNSENELVYGNHRSAAKYWGEDLTKVTTSVVPDPTIVFPEEKVNAIVGLRISPDGIGNTRCESSMT